MFTRRNTVEILVVISPFSFLPFDPPSHVPALLPSFRRQSNRRDQKSTTTSPLSDRFAHVRYEFRKVKGDTCVTPGRKRNWWTEGHSDGTTG